MPEPARWIVVENWDEFQHYKDRDPVWIKNHRTLLHKDEYLSLTLQQRGILHGLWLEYAASNREIRDNTLTISRRLGQRVTRASLEALNHAGFIGFSASKPLAPCYRDASLEKEVEREIEKKEPSPAPASPPRLRVADEVWDFVVEIEGQPLERHRKARGRIVADLKQLLNEQDVGEARRRHDALAREWGDAKATARALVQHWDRAGRMADGLMRPPERRNDGRVSPSEVYAATLSRPEPESVRRIELDAG